MFQASGRSIFNSNWHINWKLLRGQITLWWRSKEWWIIIMIALYIYIALCHLISFYIHSLRAECKDFTILKLWSSFIFYTSTLCSLPTFHIECIFSQKCQEFPILRSVHDSKTRCTVVDRIISVTKYHFSI